MSGWTLALCFAIGFIAQLIDGTLGMAYGVCCNTFLRIALKMPASVSSMLVHFSEILTTGVSAVSHFRVGNVDKKVFLRILLPGIIGGLIGALLLSELGEKLEGIISVYLVVMGVLLLAKVLLNQKPREYNTAYLTVIASVGGFADATGGGGWGPIMTSSIIHTGKNPAKMIGTINTAEFFITLVESAVFTLSIQSVSQHWKELLALMLGGVIAAPLAARLCGKLNHRLLLTLVGLLLIGLNLYKLIALFL